MGRQGSSKRERGFTLVELLVTVAVIGLISAIAVVNLLSALDRARQRQTMATMRNVASALHAYEMDRSCLPADAISAAQLSAALSNSMFKLVITTDAWGNDLHYVNVGGADYTLRSYGSDGVASPLITSATRNQYDYDILLIDGIFIASPES